MTRLCVLLTSLLLATSALGNTIKHPDCKIYLPLSEDITGWDMLKKIFIDKGYIPIELIATSFNVGDLVAGINFDLRTQKSAHTYGIQTSTCKVNFRIDKKLQDAKPSFGLIFIQEGSKTVRRFGKKLPKLTCPTKKVLQAMPTCEIDK